MKKFSVIIVMLISSLNTFSQPYNELIRRVDSLFVPWTSNNAPGCAVAIYKDGQVIHSKGYGMANLEHHIPIKPNTVFSVASVSKPFTAFAILMLEHEGKLSLEDDIRKYLPEIKDFGQIITIRHLMNFTSGLKEVFTLMVNSGWKMEDLTTNRDIFNVLKSQTTLNFEPGSTFMYNNSSYFLLARIVERVTNRRFSDFMDERVFKPLGMNNTSIVDDITTTIIDRADSYFNEGDEFRNSISNSETDGATGIYSTVEDLSKWIENMYTGRVGSPEIIKKMTIQSRLSNGDLLEYGLGFSLNKNKGEKIVWQNGIAYGYRSIIVWYPGNDFGIIILSNNGSFNSILQANLLADIFIPENANLPDQELTNKVSLSSNQIQQYSGEYTGSYECEIGINKNTVTLTLPWENKTYMLSQISKNSFIGKMDDGFGQTIKVAFPEEDKGLLLLSFGNVKYKLIKKVKSIINIESLNAFQGEYHNEEINSNYTVILKNDTLLLRQFRREDIPLIYRGNNTFTTGTWVINDIKFIKNKGGVEAFILNGYGVPNLVFKKK